MSEAARCPVCGGDTEETLATFSEVEGDRPVIVKNVPALQCVRCGEQAYTGPVLDVLERLPNEHTKPLRVISVPVFDFTTAQHGLMTPTERA